MLPIEFLNQQHNDITMPQDSKLPKSIDIIELPIFRSVRPAITLLDQTPVNGSGNAANPHSAKNFWKVENLLILLTLTWYLSANLLDINPVVLDFSLFVNGIIKKQGRQLPTKDIKNAEKGFNILLVHIALFKASGKAILLSSKGQNETRRIASQTQEEKELDKENIKLFMR